MKSRVRWVVAGVLLLALAVGSALALTSTQEPHADAKPASLSTLPTLSLTPSATTGSSSDQPAPAGSTSRSTATPVAFGARYRSPDGVVVEVTHIRRFKQPTATKGITKGTAVQVLSIRVVNGTPSQLPMSGSASMTYGPSQHRAVRLRGHGYSWSGTLPPGATTTRQLGFAVPQGYLDQATLRLWFAQGRTPVTFTGSLGYSPSDGAVFNDPTGTKADQLRITHQIERSIDGAGPGSTIRIAQYSFDIESTAQKLVAAHKRGVQVQMIVDQHNHVVTRQTKTLIKLLGENRTKKNFLVRCGASCMSNRPSTMHAKYYLFSSVGSSRFVSMVSSANITHTNSRGSWNELQTIVGNATLYGSLTRYFKDMSRDGNDRNYYRTTTSGPYTLYLFPRAARHTVLLLEALDGVSCSGAAPGYGKGGHTVLRVTMYSWRGPRVDVAKKLWSLHDHGCDVQVILNSGRTDLNIRRVLTRNSAQHGAMKVYDAWVDRDHNNVADRYMHEKGLTINGVWSGRPDTKVVYSGSQNFAPLSTTDNNEVMLRHFDDATYDAYAKNFDYVRRHGTHRIR